MNERRDFIREKIPCHGDDAYAVIFDQQGLMASLTIEGTKVSRISRPR